MIWFQSCSPRRCKIVSFARTPASICVGQKILLHTFPNAACVRILKAAHKSISRSCIIFLLRDTWSHQLWEWRGTSFSPCCYLRHAHRYTSTGNVMYGMTTTLDPQIQEPDAATLTSLEPVPCHTPHPLRDRAAHARKRQKKRANGQKKPATFKVIIATPPTHVDHTSRTKRQPSCRYESTAYR